MQNILLIEDNAADVRLFQEYLRDSSTVTYHVSNTDSLEKARHLDQLFSPEVIVVDLSLPDSSGEETVALATQYFENKPIVILTGLDDLELAKKSVKEGIQDYLVKGEINQASLRRAIQYAIERHRSVQESEQLQRSLMQRNEQLQQVNDRLEQFTHMLSHDIRGPIANILGLVQLSEMEQVPDQEMLLGRIKTTATSLDQHLNDILSLLQQQRSWAIQSSLQCWNNLYTQTSVLLDEKIRAAKAEIITNFEAPNILYPPSVLKSILLNMLSNAIKYCSPRRRLQIHLTTQEVAEGVYTLTVRDNGLGIDMAMHGEKLFTPFKRFHPDTEGKGVGLYLIRKIVEELGGKITVESQVDVGTTFTFLLSEVHSNGLG
ncbi:MAG: ATP-binding protein [Cyclobacteriaceae bacterium]